MTTEIQMADHGGLVKLFGATIHVVPPAPQPSGRTTAPTAAACKAEHRAATLQVLHSDKKPKTDDDSQRTEEQLTLPAKFKEQTCRPVDDREPEGAEEEDRDHRRCGETDEEKKKQEKQQDEKDSLMKKKPDKLLPCPRCDSMDTKFCYYNNYNVNQPRHFCRGCQRYWTAGGAVRPNMPVGAGRRKKPSRGGIGVARCHHQQDGDVVMVLQSVASAAADHDAAVTLGDGDGEGAFLSFGDGLVSPSSNFSAVRPRQLSAEQMARVESCHPVAAPQIPWGFNGVASPPPMYFYGGNQTAPAPAAVCGVTGATGFTPSPQPLHLCWTPTAAASAGWHVFSLVPWAPQMASYNPAPAPSPLVPAPIAVRKHSHSSSHSHSHSHDNDRLSFGSSVVEDSLSRQSSSSLETSPRTKVAAKKRSFAIREEEEEEVGAFGSYQLRTDMTGHRTEVASKVLQSNPAAMLRSLSFQETV